MELQSVFRLIIVLLGVFLSVRASYIVNSAPAFLFTLMFLLGIGMTGVGAYGLMFMDKYKELLETVTGLARTFDAKANAKFIKKVANGEVPADVAKVGLGFLVANPTENLASELESIIANSPTIRNKTLLMEARDDLGAKQKTADLLVRSIAERGELSPRILRGFDATTRRLMTDSILHMSPEQLQRLRIDKNNIVAAGYPDRILRGGLYRKGG